MPNKRGNSSRNTNFNHSQKFNQIHSFKYLFIYLPIRLFIYLSIVFPFDYCLKNVAYWWWRGSEYNQKIWVRLLQAILLSLDVLEIFSRSRTCLHLTEPSAGCQSYASLTNTANPNVSWTNWLVMLSETAIAVPGSCQVSSLSVDEFDIKIISNISN